jgi:PAS domain S-box-containing protein
MKGAQKTAIRVIPRNDDDLIVLLRRAVIYLVACGLALWAQGTVLHAATSVSKALLLHTEPAALLPTPALDASAPSGIFEQVRRLPSLIAQLEPGSLWQEWRGLILAIFLVVVVQSALITGLLLNRGTRRRAERALAESEERMALATQAANLGLWVWEIARDEFWVTPRFRSMFGFSTDERITFAVLRDRVHPDDRDAMERPMQGGLREKESFESEYRLSLPDGRTPWIAASGRVECSVSGAVSRMHGVCRDITERRQAQLETRQLRNEIAHVGRVSMMGQLASALAHEINQPLGAILRNAEAAELFMQSKTPDLEEVRAILADIRSDDQRAGSVIDGMRSLLKRHTLDISLLDLAELVDSVAGLARPEAATRRVKLIVDLSENLPRVRGDRVHLQQVLLNLILNGMDSLNGAHRESRRVTVSVRVDAGRAVEIAVSDTGPGIAAEKLGHIFEPFFTTKPEGMGMGLPISRTIVESHGGRLWAENNDGTGATFRFTLPPAGEGPTDGRVMRKDGGRTTHGINGQLNEVASGRTHEEAIEYGS